MESEADQSIFKLVRGRPTDPPENRKSILLINHSDLSLKIYNGHIALPNHVSTGKTPLQNLHKVALKTSLRLQCDFQVPKRRGVRQTSVLMKFETAKDRKAMIKTVKKLLANTHRFGVDSLFVRSNTGTYGYKAKEARPVDLRAIGFTDSEKPQDKVERTVPFDSQARECACTSAKTPTNDESSSLSDRKNLREELHMVKEQVQVQQSHVASLVVALITGSKPAPPGTDTDPWDYLMAFHLGPEEVAALETHDDFKNAAEARRGRSHASSKTVGSCDGRAGTGEGLAANPPELLEETSAAVAARKELGWMACAPAVQEFIRQMPNAGWAEMRQIKEVLLQEPEAGQDFVVLMQYL